MLTVSYENVAAQGNVLPRRDSVVINRSSNPLLTNFRFRSIGPARMGGRIDDNTGFSAIAIDPSNSNVFYAASYQRRRTGCCFNGGGPGSALWKTEDAGRRWKKLSEGLPPGTYGRIALDVARST